MGNSRYISWISHIYSKREQKSYDIGGDYRKNFEIKEERAWENT